MPRIQQYLAQPGGASTVNVGPAVRGPDLSGAINGVSAFADASERLRIHQEQMAEKLADDEARVHVTNTMSTAAAQWSERLDSASTGAPAGAAGFTDGMLKEFDTWAKGQESTAPERGRKYLQTELARFRQGLHADAFRFEVRSRNEKLLSDTQAGIETDARAAIAQPAAFAQVLARRLASIETLDIPAPAREKLAADAREKTAFYAGSALMQRDPAGWLARDPTKDPITSLMDPAALLRLNTAAQAELDQRKAQAMAGQDKAVRQAREELDSLRTFVLDGGLVSPEYEARVLQTAGAAPGMADAARTLVDMSRKGAGHASQPLPMQKAALAAFKPGDPEQAKLKAHMQTVTDRQDAAYRENPWQAAQQFGRAQLSPPMALSAAEAIPELVAARLKELPTVEGMAGAAVSPIRPEEVQQVQQLLAAKPVEQRADILAKMGAMLSGERLAKVAEQIDKGDRPTALMLRAAGDRTSAGVSLATRIGQGAQAIKDKAIKIESEAVTGWRAEIAEMIRPVIPDATEAQAAIDAAFYVRAAMETEGYQASFKGGNKQAAEVVVGRILDRDGMKTLLPRGTEVVDFDKKLLEYTPERLKAVGPLFIGGKPALPEFVSGRLRTMGMMRGGDGRMVPFHNGMPVTLDKEGQRPLRLEVR